MSQTKLAFIKPTRLPLGTLYMLVITLVFFVLAPGIGAITIALHRDEPVFQVQNVFFIALAGTWLFLLGRVVFTNEKQLGGWTTIVIYAMICAIAVIGVQTIIAFFLQPSTFLIQPLFVYLFYVNAAISEEIYYRVFIITAILVSLNSKDRYHGLLGVICVATGAFCSAFFTDLVIKMVLILGSCAAWFMLVGREQVPRRHQNPWAPIVAVVVSGSAFSLAHLGVYATIPLMMLSTFIGGTIMAAFLVITRNPLVPIIAHVMNNMIAAGVIITNCIVGVLV